MATDSAVRSVTNTLSTTVADTVTLLQGWPAVQITNHDTINTVYFRQDGVTAVAAADGASVLLPGQSTVAATIIIPGAAQTSVVSIVGNGGSYTIEGVN